MSGKMNIEEQLTKFEDDLKNFVPETPTEQKLKDEATASIVAFRSYAEKEGLLEKKITRNKEREMWLRRQVLDPMLRLCEARIDRFL